MVLLILLLIFLKKKRLLFIMLKYFKCLIDLRDKKTLRRGESNPAPVDENHVS